MTEVAEAPSAQKTVSHWIDGARRSGSSGVRGPIFEPASGRQTGEVDFANAADVDDAVSAARAAFPTWRALPLARRAELYFRIRQLVDEHRDDYARLLTSEHGKVLSDAAGEVARGLEVIEFCCGLPSLLKGSFSEQVSTRNRRLLHPPAARRRGRHHPLQLPGDGAHVDVGTRACLREHLRTETVGEGPLGVPAHRGSARGRRRPRGRLQRRQRRPRGGRRAHRPPRRRCDLVRRLDTDRALRLRAGDRGRQALPGARQCKEPHGRAAGRCRRARSRRGRLRGLRFRWRALHGDHDGRRGRRDRRRPRRGRPRAHRPAPRRRRPRSELRDGPARHARAPRPRRLLRRARRSRGRERGGRRAHEQPAGRGLLPRPLARRQRHARNGQLPRRDLRARSWDHARPEICHEAGPPRQRQPLRERHGDLHA